MTTLRRGGLIVFIGPVGAGKTTHMNLLASILLSNNISVKTTCIKRGFLSATFEKLLVKLIYRKNNIIKKVYPLELLLRGSPESIKKLLIIWFILDFMSLCIQHLSTILSIKIRKKVIIIEESLISTILDYLYILHKLKISMKNKHTRNLAHSLMSTLVTMYSKQHPYIVFYISCEYDELVKRWIKRGRGEISLLYIYMQKFLIKRLCKQLGIYNCIEVNSSSSIVDTQKEILRNIIRLAHQI